MKPVKKRKLLYALSLLTATVCLAAACKQDAEAAAKKKIYITEGETSKISVKGATRKTNWKISKASVANITKGKGYLNITGTAKGRTTLNATISKKNYAYEVVVETPSISESSVSLYMGDFVMLRINGTNRKTVWKSKNKNIASIDKNTGEVTAVSAGETSVYTKLGDKTYTCQVVIEKEPEISIEDLYIKNGENNIYGKIYRPEGEGKFPAIILSHGYNGTGNDFINECTYFAQNGYIAYAYDFCGGSGRSKSTGNSTDMTIFTEKSDLLAVFDYIYALEDVDPSRVYLFGGSQGGLVTTLAAEERADKVKAMALYFPALCIPDNWRNTFPDVTKIPEVYDFWGLKLGKKFFTDMHDFKVFDTIGNYDKNVLIIHGDKDPIVPLSYSERAVKTYQHAELIVLPGEAHGFTPAGGKTAREKVLHFLEENK